MAYNRRTVVPGLVDEVETASPREQKVNFRVGIADLAGGEPEDLGIAPTVPMLSIGGGGFFLLLPAAEGDESMGLVVDRASGLWQSTKTPGEADRVNGKRSKVLADLAATPFQFTAPTGAPTTWDSLILGGPAGVAIEIAKLGPVTITKQGVAVATITMSESGAVTIAAANGQLITLGGVLADFLAKWPALSAAVTALLNAGVNFAGTPADPLGENAGLAFAAALVAWQAAIGSNSPSTTVVKGQ